MSLEQRFLLLTVNRFGNQLMAFPRPARVVFPEAEQGQPDEPRLHEETCTFDDRFRGAVEAVWILLRQVLPDETRGRALELEIKARGELGGGSIGLPLVLAGVAALVSEPLDPSFQATGLMGLADGWFTGQMLSDIEAKAQALTPLAAKNGLEASFGIPRHRQVPLPPEVGHVGYRPFAHLGEAADALFPTHAQQIRERLSELWTLDHLPFSDEIRSVFRSSGASTIALECTAYEPGPLSVKVTNEPWGPTVWVDYPGLPGGGVMVYRFHQEQLTDKEHFADAEEARRLADTLTDSTQPIARRTA